MLVIMEHRDRASLLELCLDIEAVRPLDILEVDASEGGSEGCDYIHKLLRILLVYLYIEYVYIGESLEEHSLALHHGLRCKRSPVSQT